MSEQENEKPEPTQEASKSEAEKTTESNIEEEGNDPKPKKSKLKLIIILVALILTLGLGSAAAFLLLGKSSPDVGSKEEETKTEETATSKGEPYKEGELVKDVEEAKDADEQKDEEEENDRSAGGTPQFYKLRPAFVVNLPGKGRVRFMQIEVNLMTRNSKLFDELENYAPLIKNELVTLFSGQIYEKVATIDGKERLRKEATLKVDKLMEREAGLSGIDQVLFTSFVIQ